jgi:hypothetical protein
MIGGIFGGTVNRVAMARSGPLWRSIQGLLPPIAPNPKNPNTPDLSEADLLEAILLRLNDEQWQAFLLSQRSTDAINYHIINDPVVEQWERELDAELAEMKAATDDGQTRNSS